MVSLRSLVRPSSLVLSGLLPLVVSVSLSSAPALAQESTTAISAPEKISRFNEYSGYSEAKYDGFERTSQYITVRDGTRLAIDLYRPTQGGVVVEEPLPVLWTHHRYHRAMSIGGQMFTVLQTSPWLVEVIRHGYVVAAADMRGTGASFGTWTGFFTVPETDDGYDITEWLGTQEFCNGNVGMYGRSYLGITQYMAASRRPPHLKAIFPEMAAFDLYDLLYAGGIFRYDLLEEWSRIVQVLDVPDAQPKGGRPGGFFGLAKVVPVDADKDGSLLKKAIEAHRKNANIVELMEPLQFRDDTLRARPEIRPYDLWSPSSYCEEINASGIPTYHLIGWWDVFARDALLFYHNLEVPQKIVIGPWSHTQFQSFDHAAEHLRFYDYWLKGTKNKVMDEAPIHYYVMGAPGDQAWRSAWKWPLPNAKNTRYYFAAGPSGTVSSPNDGTLTRTAPETQEDGAKLRDAGTIDYSATSGKPSRWSNAYGDGALNFRYNDLSGNDRKGLTFTSAKLEKDLEITGHPLVRIWVEATAPDLDLFVYLEEIDRQGVSNYVTEGSLRTSHRKTSDQAPFKLPGFPYRRHYREDLSPLDSKPTELVFDLLPISNLFDAGHRFRVTITGADRDNARTPEVSPPPTLFLYRSPQHASSIVLPIVDPDNG